MPDAVKMLVQDHENVKKMLKQYEEMGEGQKERKRALAEKIIQELMVHERIEEDVFYPAFKEAADKEGKELVAESKEEHHVVDLILDELQDVNVGDEDFEAKFTVLKENVEHHIEEEEKEMFPQAKRMLGDRLDELGEVMAELKTSLTRQVKPPTEAGKDARRS